MKPHISNWQLDQLDAFLNRQLNPCDEQLLLEQLRQLPSPTRRVRRNTCFMERRSHVSVRRRSGSHLAQQQPNC